MTAADLRAATNAALEGAALNRQQRLKLYNPSPQVDSLLEHLLELRQYQVPTPVIRQLADDVIAIVELNDVEGDCHTHVAGELNRLLHAGRRVREQLTIKGLARVLGQPLDTLREPRQHDAGRLVTARRVIRTIIATTPRDRLLGRTLRHELGGARHQMLTQLIAEEGAR